MARSSYESETKAEGSGSPSAPSVGRRSSTPRKVTNKRSPSPSGPSRTHAFRVRRSRSTRSVGIPGSPFPTMSSAGVRIRYSPAPSVQREDAKAPQDKVGPKFADLRKAEVQLRRMGQRRSSQNMPSTYF